MSKSHNHDPEPAHKAREGERTHEHKTARAALPEPEAERIAAAAREAWSRQGEGQSADSLGGQWRFSITGERSKALRVQCGDVSEDIGQEALGVTDSEPLVALVMRVRTQAIDKTEEARANDVR